jgi:hypothetical protein
VAALSAAIENSWVGNLDGGFEVVSVVLAETVMAWVWYYCSTLQTYCHSDLQPLSVFSCPQLAVPLHDVHSAKAVQDRSLPVVHLDYAEPASSVRIRLAVCFPRSRVAPAGSLPGDVDLQHQARELVAPATVTSLPVL